MKKYMIAILFFVCWCVSAAFSEPVGLIGIAGFAAAEICLLLKINKAAALGIAAAVCVGMSIWRISFLRFVPAILFLAGIRLLMTARPPKNGRKRASADVVYTLFLFGLISAAVTLVRDIRACVLNGFSFSVSRWFWLLPFLAVYFCCILFGFRKQAAKKKQPHDFVQLLYINAFLCYMFSAAGSILSPVEASVPDVVFPWLVSLSLTPVWDDPIQQRFSARIETAARRLLRGPAE